MGAWLKNKIAAIAVRKILRQKHKDVHYKKIPQGGYTVWVDSVESGLSNKGEEIKP